MKPSILSKNMETVFYTLGSVFMLLAILILVGLIVTGYFVARKLMDIGESFGETIEKVKKVKRAPKKILRNVTNGTRQSIFANLPFFRR